MLLHEPTTPLGTFDCRALSEKVLSLDEGAWAGDPRRQQDYDVHAQTQSIILLFCEGWPKMTIVRGNGWDLLASEAVPVMDEIVRRRYPPGGSVIRAMMARLLPGCRIARHLDSHPSFSVAHRIHVPLATNADVDFVVGDERVPPRLHFAFELNNRLYHRVANNGSTSRIHFIFDYAPPTKSAS